MNAKAVNFLSRTVIPLSLRHAIKDCPKSAGRLEEAAEACERNGTKEAVREAAIVARSVACSAHVDYADPEPSRSTAYGVYEIADFVYDLRKQWEELRA